MRARIGRGVLTLAVAGLLAGCGASLAPAPAVPSPGSVAAPTSAPAAKSPEDAACAAHPASASTVRGIAAAVQKGPVLPAGVALFLVDTRQKAADARITDPALAAAETEFVAAIDDLDAQGTAGLPAGGNPAQDLVQLDATRIIAAVEAVERICESRR